MGEYKLETLKLIQPYPSDTVDLFIFAFAETTKRQTGQIVCKKVPFLGYFLLELTGILTGDPHWSPVAKFSTGDIPGGFYLLLGWTPPWTGCNDAHADLVGGGNH